MGLEPLMMSGLAALFVGYFVAKRGRRLSNDTILLVFAFTFGCTYGPEEELMATDADGRVVLTRHHTKRVGCGDAGGHAIGLFIPSVDEKTRLDLHLKEGPRAGHYDLPHTCAQTGEGEVRASRDQRVILHRCPGSKQWGVSYTILGPHSRGPVLLPPIIALATPIDGEDPDWKDVPSLVDSAGSFALSVHMHVVLDEIQRVDGDEAFRIALAKTVHGQSAGWMKRFERVPIEHRGPILEALRAYLRDADDPTFDALSRGAKLVGDDPSIRQMISKQASQRRESDKTDSGGACNLLIGLMEHGIDDLDDLACSLTASPCSAAAFKVLSSSAKLTCDRMAETAPWALCRTTTCGDRLCTPDELAEKVPVAHEAWQDYNQRHEVASTLAQEAIRIRPELYEKMEKRIARKHYSFATPVEMCARDAPKHAECLCGLSEIVSRAHICRLETEAMRLPVGRCVIEIDDERQTLRSVLVSPFRDAPTDTGND